MLLPGIPLAASLFATVGVTALVVVAIAAAVVSALLFRRAQSQAPPADGLADMIRAQERIGDRIETLVGQQQLQAETQRQSLAQSLDAIGQAVGEQRHQVDGLRNELRHEVRRRDAEIEEIRSQLVSIQAAQVGPGAPPLRALAAPADPLTPAAADTPGADAPAASEDAPVEAIPVAEAAPVAETSPAEDSFADASFVDASFVDASFAEAPFADDSFAEPSLVDTPFAATSFDDVSLGDSSLGTVSALPPTDGPEAPADTGFSFPSAPFDSGDGAASPFQFPAPEPAASTAPAEPPPAEVPTFEFADLGLTPEPPTAFEPPPSPAGLSESPFEGAFDFPSAAAFEPTAFEPTAFEPTAFEPTAFVTGFEPSAFEPAAFEPAAFEPSAFEPTPPVAEIPPPVEAPAPSDPWTATASAFPLDLTFPAAEILSPEPFGAPSAGPSATFGESAAPAFAPQAFGAPAFESQPDALHVTPTADVAWVSRPDTSTEPPAPAAPVAVPEGADDLTVIAGITAEIQQQLYADGISTLDEIARWSRSDARAVAAKVGVTEDVILNQWVFEAQAALYQSYTGRI